MLWVEYSEFEMGSVEKEEGVLWCSRQREWLFKDEALFPKCEKATAATKRVLNWFCQDLGIN